MSLSGHTTSTCPYCAEIIELPLDPDQPASTLIEDCPVCCRPMQVRIHINDYGEPTIAAIFRDDD